MKLKYLYMKIKRKYCKHKILHSSNYEVITKNSYYEYIRCNKCGAMRRDLISLGHRVEGEWKHENN